MNGGQEPTIALRTFNVSHVSESSRVRNRRETVLGSSDFLLPDAKAAYPICARAIFFSILAAAFSAFFRRVNTLRI